MNLILLGLPGAGKGTHARKLMKKYDMIHLSTGKLIRKTARQNTSIGTVARRYINEGKLVPDEIAVKLVRNKVMKFKEKDIIFDGFPRNIFQIQALEHILQEIEENISLCIYLKVAEKNLIERLQGRRICSYDGSIYHVKYNPPQTKGICDKCGGKLHHRKDDETGIIRKKIQENKKNIKIIRNYYRKKNILKCIEATDKNPESVQNEIENIIKNVDEKIINK
ncbi:MAG: adenylate kinase family protein [bacterium]